MGCFRSIQLDNRITSRNLVRHHPTNQEATMHPQRTNPDPGYFPVSERMAGWVIGAFIIIDCLIIVAVLLGAMWAFG